MPHEDTLKERTREIVDAISQIYKEYKNKLYQKDSWQGINIYRVKAVTGYKTSLLKKLLKASQFLF